MAITTLSSINTKNGQRKQPDPWSFTKMLEELKEVCFVLILTK